LTLRFAPRWYYVLLTAVAVPLFMSLGFWQLHRGQYRSEQWASFARTDLPAIDTSAATLARLPQFTRVRVAGEFDAAHQFLLDNISHDGAPGYEALTVLRLLDGSQLLVNRGWLPFNGRRDQLPDLSIPASGVQNLTGRLSTLPVAGMAAGHMPPPASGDWPRRTSFPASADLEQALGELLLAPVLLLDADSGPGYLRQWRPPGISPDRNYSYAVQWWSFALLAVAMFVWFNLKRVK
jgi:surfeit locus 1 family protein